MKRKGFTLIELLAVIVILAVISLIATPIILSVIEKAKQGSAEQSAIGYINGIENSIIVSELKDNTITDGSYNVLELEAEVKGEKPSSGNVTIEKGIVVDAVLCISNYKISYSNNKAEIQGKCEEEIVYSESLLNGTDPKIEGKLIPVTISNDGTVTYADINKRWYSYRNKEWANAVILEEGKTYNVGDTISEEDIESYFVWIPRYRYKLFNTSETDLITTGELINKAQIIEIEFENKETTPSIGSVNDEWLTHPAFTSFNSNGMWVGKFETGYKGAEGTEEAQKNENNSNKVIIKPNVYSWRNITVGNIFQTSYNYERELDSHMMKNTEWGAVAYLSHSKYGIGTEVNINNNSSYKTGYSALPSTNQQTSPGTYGDGNTYNSAYNTEIGYLASTTGNITGVYDMSGGTWEYMASYRSETFGNSGFTEETIANYESKYFDVYNASSSVATYQYRILGDATGEMGPFKEYLDGDGTSRYHNSWYTSASFFILYSDPWFGRGGNYGNGVLTGQFGFNSYKGGSYNYFGFRLVLTP